MNANYLKGIFKRLEVLTVKHAPEILAGVGIGGFATSIVLAVKATPKAEALIEDKKHEIATVEQASVKDINLSTMDKVKAAWKPFLPVAVTAAASTLCVIGSVSTSLRRSAALATALEISRTFADEYKHKVIETIGEKKELKIREAIAQDNVQKNPPVTGVNLIAPGEDGVHRVLFYETISKRYFWAKKEDVEKAIIKFYKEVKGSWGNYSFYSWLLLLESYGIKVIDGLPDGEADKYMGIGWEGSSTESCDLVEAELINRQVHGGEWDGYPCLVIDYSIKPSDIYGSAFY